jgi:cobalt-zinc-cadmium resistance protein CzcA
VCGCLILACFGGVIFKQLNVDAVPDITNNQVQINTSAIGFSPEEVEKKITLPIEMALQGIKGLESTRSLSRDSFSQVTAVFDEDLDIYFVRQQIAERLHGLTGELPAEPQMGSISTGLGEVFMWVVDYEDHPVFSTPGAQKDGSYITPEGMRLTTDLEKLSYLREIQDWVIKPQLKSVKGVADIDSIGGFVKEYQVAPILEKLQLYGLSFEDIVRTIEDNHLSLGASFIDRRGESFLVKADGRLQRVEDLAELWVKDQILLKEVATIGFGKELRSGGATYNGKEVVTGTAMMLIGENTRAVAQAVSNKLDQVVHSLPPGIHLTKVLNRTKLIDSTIGTVQTNLLEGALLVVLVLFVFLKNYRAALICASIIPISMLLTIMGMIQGGMSGNLMSLGAIDFGLIVDGAVIITENTLRRLHAKRAALKRVLSEQERLDEVKKSSLEMIRPSLFGQLIIITVYVPILTLVGVEGKMFKPMAYTVIMALMAALILSMTFIPALLSIWIKGDEKESGWLEGLKAIYQRSLKKWLAKPLPLLWMGLLTVGLGYGLYKQLGQEFVTALDEGDIAVQVTRIPSTALDQALNMQRRIEKALLGVEEVKLVFSKTGTAEMATDPMPKDASDTFVMLKNRNEWSDPKLSQEALIEKLEAALKKQIGNQFEYTQPINMRFNELIGGVKSDVAIHLYGDDFEQLAKLGSEVGSLLGQIRGATDVVVEPLEGMLTYELVPDRWALSHFGLSVKDLFNIFEMGVQGKKAGEIFEGDRKFDVYVRLDEKVRHQIPILEKLPIYNREGKQVFLKDVGQIHPKEGLNQISRMDGKRMITVQANVRHRDLGSFIEEVKATLLNKKIVPAGYWYSIGGQYEHLASAKRRLSIVVPVCLLMIALFLYLSLKNFKDAVLVFSSVPFALVGGITLLFLRGMPFSISSAIGLIALSGIAVLNALVLLTAIKKLREQGVGLDEAIVEGALMRLRPVLMTASVASFGFLPMALSTSAGAEVQKPIATVVIGGLVSSTLLTLVLIPAYYKLICMPRREGSINGFIFFKKRIKSGI